MFTHPAPIQLPRPKRHLVPHVTPPKTELEQFRDDIQSEVHTATDIGPRHPLRDSSHDKVSLLTRSALLRIAACRAVGVSLAHWSAGRLLEDECRLAGVDPHSVAWSGTRAEHLVAAALSKPIIGHKACPACDGTGPGHVATCVLHD